MTIALPAAPPQGAPLMRVFHPEYPLTALVNRPGGLPREVAIAQAARRMGEQREPALKAIDILIATLEAMIAPQAPIVPGELPDFRRVTDQVIALACTFQLAALAQAGKLLGDLIAAFAAANGAYREPVAVHVRALRLFGPFSAPPPPHVAENVLLELTLLLRYFGAVSRTD